MKAPRIFVSYSGVEKTDSEHQFAMRLIDDLQSAGADIVTNEASISNDSFVQMLNQELPKCQWFLLIETPKALASPKVQMSVNTALNLLAQRRIQGAFRVIATRSSPQALPPTWTRLREIDARQDYPRALTKLQLALGLKSTGSQHPVPSSVAPPFSPTPAVLYDRPTAAPPSRFPFLQSQKGRRSMLVALIALVLLGITGSILGSFLLSQRSRATGTNQAVGYAHFISTGMLDVNNVRGINDGVQVDLSNLATPAANKSYYAWLLSDKQQTEARSIPLGKLQVQQGAVHSTYVDSSHIDLLAIASRFLVTEENTNPTPDNPSPDKTTWRYYAEIPQAANPNDMMHLSLLAHLRHLLVSEPTIQKMSLSGGLNNWFFQNTGKVLEWATAARGTGQPQDPELMHRHFVRILDYLDGLKYIQSDIPPGTPVLVNPRAAQVGLLTLDPMHEDPPGYVRHIGMHLEAMIDAPGAVKDQRTLAGKIDIALNNVEADLAKARQDAIKLVHMSDAQLLDPTTVPFLDDLFVQANTAFTGQVDATTGTRQGGATWIHDQLEYLASFSIEKYSA